jgi:dTDP-glucose 4,6-dehydratase
VAFKVLISGSCGFVFSNYIIYLLQHTDWDIVSIDKLTTSSFIGNVVQNKRHKLYIGDICDYHFVQKVFEIEQPEIILHGAAESFVDASLINSRSFMQSNVIGTHSMLEACLKGFMPKLFVNFETDEEYGEILSGSFKETDILKPRNPYSVSKAASDLMGQSYYTTFGVPVITTRCCNIFGPRQNKEKMIPKIISNILMNKPVPVYGEGKQIREWIYVKDVYLATQKIIECGKVGEIYNISANHEETNIDLVNKILFT